MKRSKLMLAIVAFSLFSCKDYNVKTIVHEDGSIEKVIKINSRDEIKNLSGLFFNIDSSWTVIHEKDSITSSYTTVAKREFESVSELIDKYGSPYGVVMEVNLAKRFRWFYTYFEYQEIIEKTNSFNAIKVEDFLTPDEYRELESGEISEALSERLDSYLQASALKELTDNLKSLFDTHNFDTSRISESEDILKEMFELDIKADWLVNSMKIIFPDQDISGLSDQIADIYKALEDKVEGLFFQVGSDFEYEIALPGLILETNAKSIEGSTGYWKFDAENFTYADYKMHILSRKANVWTMFATGGAVLALIALLFVPVFRRRN